MREQACKLAGAERELSNGFAHLEREGKVLADRLDELGGADDVLQRDRQKSART